MIGEYGWSIVIAVYLVYTLGIGILIYGIMFVWSHVFELSLTLFRVKKAFLEWIREKNKPKVYTPDLSDEKRAEIRESLTRKKEKE